MGSHRRIQENSNFIIIVWYLGNRSSSSYNVRIDGLIGRRHITIGLFLPFFLLFLVRISLLLPAFITFMAGLLVVVTCNITTFVLSLFDGSNFIEQGGGTGPATFFIYDPFLDYLWEKVLRRSRGEKGLGYCRVRIG